MRGNESENVLLAMQNVKMCACIKIIVGCCIHSNHSFFIYRLNAGYGRGVIIGGIG